jgi:hypothetical protein
VTGEDDDDVLFVLEQQDKLDCCSASSLKQQSADSHFALLGQSILTRSQIVFLLISLLCVLNVEAAYICIICLD